MVTWWSSWNSWCCYELQQWPISNDIFIPLVILHFPFFWLFGSFLSLWSYITWSTVSSFHVATFHPHFLQVTMMVGLWSFCNSWCLGEFHPNVILHMLLLWSYITINLLFWKSELSMIMKDSIFSFFSTNYHCQ